MGDLMIKTMGIDVTRRAESIGDGPSSWGGHHIPQPEITPLCHAVTLCVTLLAAVLAVFLAAALAVFKFLAVLAVLAAALAAALLYSNLSMCTEKYGRPGPTDRGHMSRSVSRSGGWGPWRATRG